MLRIVTLNLNYYIEKHGPWEMRKKLILQLLREKEPHIVAFQAVAKHNERYSGKDQAFQICEELNGFQSHYFEQVQILPDGTMQGSAVISKLPMLEKTSQKLTLKQGLEDTNQRTVLKTAFQIQNLMLDFYNAHFSWVEEQAVLNVKETASFIKDKSSLQYLLAGDLNTLPESKVFQPFKDAGLSDIWQKLHESENGPTFESGDPSIRIDYFWLSPSLADKVNTIEVLASRNGSNVRFSDHLALMLELNIEV